MVEWLLLSNHLIFRDRDTLLSIPANVEIFCEDFFG